EAVARGIQLAAPEPRELPTNEAVVFTEQLAPARVAKLGRPLGRAGNVSEQNRDEDSVALVLRRRLRRLSQEALDCVRHLVTFLEERPKCTARELEVARARNPLDDVAADLAEDELLARPVQDEHRHADRRQHV